MKTKEQEIIEKIDSIVYDIKAHKRNRVYPIQYDINLRYLTEIKEALSLQSKELSKLQERVKELKAELITVQAIAHTACIDRVQLKSQLAEKDKQWEWLQKEIPKHYGIGIVEETIRIPRKKLILDLIKQAREKT